MRAYRSVTNSDIRSVKCWVLIIIVKIHKIIVRRNPKVIENVSGPQFHNIERSKYSRMKQI